MDPGTATLLAAGIGFAGSVIAASISQADIEINVVKTQYIPKESVAIVKEQVLNKQFLQNVIVQTYEHFSRLLDQQTDTIINEIQIQQIRYAVNDVQAHVQALQNLLELNTIDDPILAIQLVTTALNPLQVSIEKARLQLEDYEGQEVWQYCHIVGTSALIAGFAFLGQDMPLLRQSLDKTIKRIQLHLLDEIAIKMLQSQEEFPWEQVPYLLTYEGVDRLLELYQKTTGNRFTDFSSTSLRINISQMTVEEVRQFLPQISDSQLLNEMISQEMTGKGRSTAIRAIRERINQLQ